MKEYFFAIAILVGTVVGAGIFGLPYVIAKAGVFAGLFLLVFAGGLVFLIKLLYGEVILRTRGQHRFVGYAKKYLGKKGEVVAAFSTIFGFFGSLLAYLILGGFFLQTLLGEFFKEKELLCVLLFFFLGAVAILAGLKMVSASEFLISGLLIFVVLILAVKSWPHARLVNFSFFDQRHLFLAYGVIFYSFLGSSALPEMRQILRGREKKFKSAIFWGLFIPAVIYAVFALLVIGVSGSATSPEAIAGLVPFLGSWVIKLGAFFGFLCVFSSFIILGLCLKTVFHLDFGFSKKISWFLVIAVPLALFLAGFQNFVKVIGLVGIVMGGLEGILIILIYKKADKTGDRRPEYDIVVPNLVIWFLIAVFAFGMIYQLYTMNG